MSDVPALYDDPGFFGSYQRMRAEGGGFNEALEQPAMRALLPDPKGLDVLDVGCGDGAAAERLATAGASSVVGADPSERMLELARSRADGRVRYVRARAEDLDFPDASLDLIVSSLALHYVPGLPEVLARMACWLRPGGRLVYSVEHPVCTAQDPMDGWAEEGAVWPVTAYGREAARRQVWFGAEVTKFHYRVSTHLGALIGAGLALTAVDEPQPAPELVAHRPDLAGHAIRPPLLLLAARKPPKTPSRPQQDAGSTAREGFGS